MTCKTAHALAYAAVGHHYAERLNSPRMASVKTGSSLGITMEVELGDRKVTAGVLSYTTLDTVIRFFLHVGLGAVAGVEPRGDDDRCP